MKVTICGPNLRDQSKGEFHVHAAGCADLQRGAHAEPEYRNGWTIEASTRLEVVIEIMPPDEMDWNPDNPSDRMLYESDVHFFPCCNVLKGD